MAFNLSKNEGDSKSKFDLSKSDVSTPDFKEPKNNNKTILIIVLIVVFAGAIYFLTDSSKTEDNVTVATDSTTTSTSDTATNNVQQSPSTNITTTNSVSNSAPSIDAPAKFEKGSADVNNIDDSKVNQILEYIKSNSSAVITIEGYASSEGELDFNQKLSENRASNFAKYLVSKGISKENLKTIGKGVENPIASNDDENGRAQNRRVEIEF
jgi:outer membrane protein OmpA-like peptidoglycan-associated protein